jgi:hypothetical protein
MTMRRRPGKRIFAASLDVPLFLPHYVGGAMGDARNATGLVHLKGLHAFETRQVARNHTC